MKKALWEEYHDAESLSQCLLNKGICRNAKEVSQWIHRNIPKEQYFQTKILEGLKRHYPSGFWWKDHSSGYQRRGIPDICGILDGQYYGFEVKRPILGTPTTIQLKTLEQIRSAGGVCGVVTNFGQVAAVIESGGMCRWHTLK